MLVIYNIKKLLIDSNSLLILINGTIYIQFLNFKSLKYYLLEK